MIIELSKDKSLVSILKRVDLDDETKSLVESNASASSILKSLHNNINPSNIVKYRKYILKAEEESLKEKEEAKITDSQISQLVSLMSEKDKIDADEVDIDTLPKTKQEAESLIEDLKRELETGKDMGVLTDDESGSAVKPSEMQTDKDKDAKFRILTGDDRTKRLDKEIAKKQLITTMNQAQNWSNELKDLVDKLNITVNNEAIKINRMNEYQAFGVSKDESNKVIGLVKLYEGNSDYLLDKYSESIESYEGPLSGGKQVDNAVVYYKESKVGDGLFLANNYIDVQPINDALKSIVKEYQGVLLSDILEEMHRNFHGKQSVFSRNPAQRKDELQRLQRLVTGESPRDRSSFNRLKKNMNYLNRSLQKARVQQSILSDVISELQNVKSDTDKLVARKIRKLIVGVKSVKNISRIKGIMQEIQDITENPEPYIEELTEKIEEDIEREELKLKTVSNVLISLEETSPPLKRVRRALGEVDLLREQTGKEPAGELKRILGKLSVLVIKIKTLSRKIQTTSEKLPEEAEKSIADWLLDNMDKTVTFDDGGVNYGGVSDISYESIRNLESLKEKFNETVNEIESIMNEYDSLVGSD